MLQIKFLGIGNHGVAEATGFQRSKGIFLAPHPVDFIEILGAEVAYEVGFSAPSYFTKCFKEEYGMLPGDVGNVMK